VLGVNNSILYHGNRQLNLVHEMEMFHPVVQHPNAGDIKLKFSINVFRTGISKRYMVWKNTEQLILE
jgi:hypothetical protein